MGNGTEIGGVTYSKGIVASQQKPSEQNGNKYIVNLTNGVRLEYTAQEGASVKVKTHGLIKKCHHTVVTGLSDALIAGSTGKDAISAYFCNNVDIDVSNDHHDLPFGNDVVNVQVSEGRTNTVRVRANQGDKVTAYTNDEDGKPVSIKPKQSNGFNYEI